MDTLTYDDLVYRLKKGTKLILITDYVRPEYLNKRGTILKSVKDKHINEVYDAFEAFSIIYGSAIQDHNDWVYSKTDSVLFSTIKAH